jgi:hypothetical protein
VSAASETNFGLSHAPAFDIIPPNVFKAFGVRWVETRPVAVTHAH